MTSKPVVKKRAVKTSAKRAPRKCAAKAEDKLSPLYKQIYATVKRIPKGKVASYGQVAAVAGYERHARLVGYALNHLKRGNPGHVPWQRVINAQGFISLKDHEGGAIIQRKLLESEGIEFGPNDKVDWKRFGWRPRTRKK